MTETEEAGECMMSQERRPSDDVMTKMFYYGTDLSSDQQIFVIAKHGVNIMAAVRLRSEDGLSVFRDLRVDQEDVKRVKDLLAEHLRRWLKHWQCWCYAVADTESRPVFESAGFAEAVDEGVPDCLQSDEGNVIMRWVP